MNSKVRKIVFALLATALLLSGTISCNIDQRETETIINIQYFHIEPKSILESISQGSKNTFIAVSAEPELASSSKDDPVAWKQADYFQIANALHEFVWGESLKTWNLYRMSFSLSCDQIDIGLQYGQFAFFKVINLDGQETRVEHFIEIDPARNFAQAIETNYYPNLEDRKAIDLANIKIFASEALQIAENDGGYEKRMAVKNACGISVGMSRDTVVYDGWLVIYSPSVFTDKIDPVTGK